MSTPSQICQTANRNLGKLFIIGFVGVIAYNVRQWQRDKALVERLRSQRGSAPALVRTPKVSALVAAWNEAEHIDAHIQSFLALAYPDIELLLCAGGTDDTFLRAQRYQSERISVIEQLPGEGKQRALARCYEQAQGEIIYLTDADCRFDDEALVHLLAPIVNEGEQVATGTSRPLEEQAQRVLPTYLWMSDVVAGVNAPTYGAGLLGRNAAVTRTAIEQSGGLDFAARTGTDYQLARRLIAAGYRIRTIGASCIASAYPATIGSYRRKQSRWLRNLLIHGRRYGARADVMVTLRTVGVGWAMLLTPLLALGLGPLVLLPWALLLAHAVAAKLRYISFAARLHSRAVPARLLVAFVPLTLIDFAIWALPIIDLLHPKRREQW